ncbi:hypothetical protein HJ071_09930 [Vibrio parahaemolyticus]|nr:hypothetical protein [Vibrio parahaemolyticus]
MAGVTLIKPSMSAGELSPEMYGRVDTEHYQLGLALARNFYVDYHGGLTNRPGTYFINAVPTMVRHIPFERSATETYMLEFGDYTMRVLNQGAYILDETGIPLEVATPYSASELDDIRHIQSVDVMTLFHFDYAMYQVKHYAIDDWRVEIFETKSGPYDSINIDETKNMWADGQTGTVNIYSDFDVFTDDMVGRKLYLEATGAYYTKSWIQRMVAKVGDICYYAGNYYVCTEARANSLTGDAPPIHTEGERWDGPDQDIPNDNDDHYIGIKWRYSNSGFGEVKIISVESPTHITAEVIKELPKDLSGIGAVEPIEWLWESTPYQESFDITSPTPDTYDQTLYSVYFKLESEFSYDFEEIERDGNWYVFDLWGTPKLFINEQSNWNTASGQIGDLKLIRAGSPEVDQKTYKWAFESLNDQNGYPKCGAYYSQRLSLGGNRKDAQKIWMSKTDSYDDFGTSKPILAEDSLTLAVTGVKLSEIEHLLPFNALLAFTSGGVWAVLPAETQRVTAEDPPAINIQSYNGCSKIAPIITGGEGLYIQSGERIIREILYDFGRNSFVDTNLCVRSSHIFKYRKVVSWAFSKNPNFLVWCVFDDGTAATLTYIKEQQVWGWTTHVTAGKYKAVSAVEEPDRTAVYFVVERRNETGTYLATEYQADRNFLDLNDAFFLDCGKTVSNKADGYLTFSDGTNWNYPEVITLNSSIDYFTADHVSKKIIIKPEDSEMKDNVYSLTIMEFVDSKTVKARLEQKIPDDLQDESLSNWGIDIEYIDGLEHLNGVTVRTINDGMVGPNLVVKDGKIKIETPSLITHVGIGYRSIGKTLPLDIQTKYSQTVKNKVKAINKVNMELHDSFGGLAGTNIKNMYEIKQRKYEDYNSPTNKLNGVAGVEVSSSYNPQGQFYFMQDEPLPFSVLSLIPEVEIGG